MKKIKSFFEKIKKYRIACILLIGCFLRLFLIGTVPADGVFNQDEAFAAYEAYSMVNYGMDSHGYSNPVYLETWGSGMSAVQSFIERPFIRILGLTPIAVRLPQALLGCITLVFFYLLIKEVHDEESAFWATFILSICPWHIMMSRWGLDCNYVVAFLTVSMYFLVSSDNKIWKTILAGVFTGITVYCYAAIWIVFPFFVLGMIIYLYATKQMTLKSVLIYVLSTGIVCIPILLFVAVNMGLIPELRSKIISIPKLSFFRSDDVSFSLRVILERLIITAKILWKQDDQIIWNSFPPFGLYYMFSNVLLILGFVISFIKRKKNTPVIWIWFSVSVLLAALIEVNINRINIIFIPIIFFIGLGISFLVELPKKYSFIPGILVIAVYGFFAVRFSVFYFTDYNRIIKNAWHDGAKEVITLAQESTGVTHIYTDDMYYPLILCYSKYPADRFVETVEYLDPDAAFLQPVSFDGYYINDFTSEAPVSGDAYICSVSNDAAANYLISNNMNPVQYGNYYIGIAE